MEIGRIQNATRVVGKSQGYIDLPLRDVQLKCAVNGEGTPAMETAWFPTPEELIAINAGAPIILRVLGTQHPPVFIYAGDQPDA